MELLQVLRRFFSICGYPKLLLSDNGTQMVGADNELKLMIQNWDERQLKEFQSLLQQKDEQIAQLMEEGKLQNVE